jgi:zinc protease
VWFASGGVQTNKTKESLVEFDKEFKNIGGVKPISDTEFADAKAKITRGYAQQFESLSRLNQQVADLWTAGLPMAELQREYDEASKAEIGAVRAAATKYAKSDRATVLLVGDLDKIEAGVRDLKLGDIVVLDVEGKPVANRKTASAN